MTQGQIDALQIVLISDSIMSALKEVFNEAYAEKGPAIYNESDEIIGQKYRAYSTAKQVINHAFTQLESYKKPKQSDAVDALHI